MAVYTHCCRAQPLRQLGFLVEIAQKYKCGCTNTACVIESLAKADGGSISEVVKTCPFRMVIMYISCQLTLQFWTCLL